MRCDLHVHARHSGTCTIPRLNRVCGESYNRPAEVYDKLKRLGMGLVTITDHDSIGALEELRSKSDLFLREEVTCILPSGRELRVGVHDISDRHDVELQRRRNDFESFRVYLEKRELFYSANHIFSSLTGAPSIGDFELFERAFPALETRNVEMLQIANENAALLADFAARGEGGGSDAHALASVGCAYTVVPYARDKREFLDGLRRGRGGVRGETGSYMKLTRDVEHRPQHGGKQSLDGTRCPLRGCGSLVTLGNYVVESVFARWWLSRYLKLRALRVANPAAGPGAEAA